MSKPTDLGVGGLSCGFRIEGNRNEGEDSRNANTGNILKKNIVGKAWLRINSLAVINSINEFGEDSSSGKE